jgi:hypothetical protein
MNHHNYDEPGDMQAVAKYLTDKKAVVLPHGEISRLIIGTKKTVDKSGKEQEARRVEREIKDCAIIALHAAKLMSKGTAGFYSKEFALDDKSITDWNTAIRRIHNGQSSINFTFMAQRALKVRKGGDFARFLMLKAKAGVKSQDSEMCELRQKAKVPYDTISSLTATSSFSDQLAYSVETQLAILQSVENALCRGEASYIVNYSATMSADLASLHNLFLNIFEESIRDSNMGFKLTDEALVLMGQLFDQAIHHIGILSPSNSCILSPEAKSLADGFTQLCPSVFTDCLDSYLRFFSVCLDDQHNVVVQDGEDAAAVEMDSDETPERQVMKKTYIFMRRHLL